MQNKRIVQAFLSIGAIFCLFIEAAHNEQPQKITSMIESPQISNEIIEEDINFDNVTYDIVSEKIAVNPNYIFTEEETTIYANKNDVLVLSSPEDNPETIFKLSKRESLKSLGYNSYNKMYEVEDINGDIYYVNADDFSLDKNLILDDASGNKFTNTFTNIIDYPSETSNVISSLPINAQVQLLGKNDNGYYKIKYNDKEGFIKENLLSDNKTNYITEQQKTIANIARNNAGTYPCTSGYCAAWVSGVYQASGYCSPSGNAIDFWLQWKDSGSTSMDNIPVGAVVVGSGSGSALGNQYGHVGVYLGDGLVAENVGYHRIISIQEWAASQVGYCRGYHGYIGWVWPCNTVLGDGV